MCKQKTHLSKKKCHRHAKLPNRSNIVVSAEKKAAEEQKKLAVLTHGAHQNANLELRRKRRECTKRSACQKHHKNEQMRLNIAVNGEKKVAKERIKHAALTNGAHQHVNLVTKRRKSLQQQPKQQPINGPQMRTLVN